VAAETLFIATTPGLEQVLLAEARALGEAKVVPGGVRLTGAEGVHRLANLRLRCASRVWLVAPASLPESARRKIDTSGELLYRRGYRQEVSRAPLRETLAAGLLRLARHRPTEPLWDPLCGSGTLAIEAALMNRGIAPGLFRSFAFEQFPTHDPVAYEREKAALRSSQLPRVPAPIWASDLNAGSLGTARRNAARGGVASDLKLFRSDATQPVPDLPPGALVISNLPYGKRAGAGSDLPALYRAVVEACRQSGAARAGFLTADPRAPGWLGLKNAEITPVENGGLKCLFVVGEL
jgi:putative N6-adenine-specific DNA methylase